MQLILRLGRVLACASLATLATGPSPAAAQDSRWQAAVEVYRHAKDGAVRLTSAQDVGRCAELWSAWSRQVMGGGIPQSRLATLPPELHARSGESATGWAAQADRELSPIERTAFRAWAQRTASIAANAQADPPELFEALTWLGRCQLGAERGPARRLQAVCEPGKSGIAYGQAVNEDWYVFNNSIEVRGRRYERFGLPRVLLMGTLDHYHTHEGVEVFREIGSSDTDMIYVLLSPDDYVTDRPHDCKYQPYRRI